jgi:hypothetical protein
MRNIFVMLLLLAITVVFCAVAAAQPKLTIPNAEFDFGYVPQHATISHVFWLYSTGTDSLKIVNVRPG